MKRLIFAVLTIALVSSFALAQSADEQEIMKIHKGLEKAYIAGEIAPFEAALADYYTFTGPEGTQQTRKEALDDMRKEIAKPSFKNISEVSDNLKVHVLGNAAFVTASWTSIGQGLAVGSEPHTDKGQYTGIYEKIGGKWMLIREVFTEAQHDRKLMEQEVIATSLTFDTAMKTRDAALYERLLHPDYLYTTSDGELVTRADEIKHFVASEIVIKTVETTDKKVRIISNSSAVETGQYHVIGTNKGKPFEETGRYTTTWAWKDLRWQVIADHNSIVKK